MNYVFASSHLPEDNRPEDEEEDDDDVQPMLRAGGVRALSPLPPARRLADSSGPLSTRPVTPIGRPRLYTSPEDDRRAHEYTDDTPWHRPRITAQDLPPQYHEDRENAQGRDDPDTSMLRSAPSPRSSVFAPSPQDRHRALSDGRDDSTGSGNAGYRDPATGQLGGLADKAEFHDLVYRPQGSPEERGDQRRGFLQNVSDIRGARLAQSSAPRRPANSTPSAPQTTTQGSKPGAQPPASKPATVQGAAPQKPAANGQTPQRQYTPEEREEIFTPEGKERKPIGQLGISGGTGKDGRPKTVCLYDGSETRKKDGQSYEADAYALQRAAQAYASDGTWVIDISQPGWEDKLRAIQRATEGEGKTSDPTKGIDRIMIFDHAGAASHEFGSSLDIATKQRKPNHLEPNSPAWKVITSSIRPKGDIVLTGCETAKQAWNDWNPLTNEKGRYLAYDGEKYLHDMFYASNATRSPTIHAYDGFVRHRTDRFKPSLTAGRQHSFSFEGHKITE
jgi:hypothetical protein